MKRRRGLSVLLALVLIVACIAAGCSGGKSGSSEVTTVTIWTGNSHSKITMERLAQEFNEGKGKELGIQIDYQVIEGNSFAQNLELALQTGQGPDIMPKSFENKVMVGNGWIYPINDLPGGEDFLKPFRDYFGDTNLEYKGKIYSVPTSVTTRGLIYNKDMFKAAGLVDENGEPTPPETFDEMREYAKILTDESKNQFGIILPMKWNSWVGSDMTTLLISSVGHSGFNPVNGEFDYSGLAPIINTYKGMIEDGSVYPGAEGLDNDAARAYFAEGIIGMKIAFSFDVGVLNDQFPAKCDWGVAPVPVVDKNNRYLQNASAGTAFCVNAASVETKGAEKIMAALKWISGDDVARVLYEEGANIPFDWDVVKDVKLENAKKGWKEFSELAGISHLASAMPRSDMSGYLTLDERIKNQVLAGEISAEDMLKQYNEDITQATKKYYDANPDEKFEDYLVPDWNIKR